jgi:hypothetical protein
VVAEGIGELVLVVAVEGELVSVEGELVAIVVGEEPESAILVVVFPKI